MYDKSQILPKIISQSLRLTLGAKYATFAVKYANSFRNFSSTTHEIKINRDKIEGLYTKYGLMWMKD